MPLVRRSGVDPQRAKRLEPEDTAMLMHRGRSCASQHKLVIDWQASKREDAVKCLSVGAIKYEHQHQVMPESLTPQPEWGNTAPEDALIHLALFERTSRTKQMFASSRLRGHKSELAWQN
jgi:hypothetical protein